MKYWLIIIDWDGDVDYGVDRASFLGGIYISKEEAEEAMHLERIAKKIEEVRELCSGYSDGCCEARLMEFDPNGDINDHYLGGGSYLE